MTPESFNRLPKWAQIEFKDIQRERDVAVYELNKWVDAQTPSKMYVDEMVCTGEERGPSTKRRYIQGHRITVEHAGIRLDVSTLDERSIEIRWDAQDRSIRGLAFIPFSFQNARIVHPENMRA